MSKILFDVITLFPSYFSSPLKTSLIEKAVKNGLVDVKTYDLRDFGIGKHRRVDDRPFGGGPGMVIRVDVLSRALAAVKKTSSKKPYTILLDPSGNKFVQETAASLAKKKRIILICGHYEGVDERFKNEVDEIISIGDYILTGGETAALVLLDSISRLVEGFMNSPESTQMESFSNTTLAEISVKTLDYPVYTRPEIFKKRIVPKTLLSGNHKKIKNWRKKAALAKTESLRPDLLNRI